MERDSKLGKREQTEQPKSKSKLPDPSIHETEQSKLHPEPKSKLPPEPKSKLPEPSAPELDEDLDVDSLDSTNIYAYFHGEPQPLFNTSSASTSTIQEGLL